MKDTSGVKSKEEIIREIWATVQGFQVRDGNNQLQFTVVLVPLEKTCYVLVNFPNPSRQQENDGMQILKKRALELVSRQADVITRRAAKNLRRAAKNLRRANR